LLTHTGRPKIDVRTTILSFGQIIAKKAFVEVETVCCKKTTSGFNPYFSAGNKDFAGKLRAGVDFYKHLRQFPTDFEVLLFFIVETCRIIV